MKAGPAHVGVALLYHGVGEAPGGRTQEIVARVGTARFQEQLTFVARHFRPVPASELLAALLSRRRGTAIPIALTFDDDLRSHVEVAMPMLRAMGLPATFFLSGASSDGPFAFWWELLQAAVDLRLDVRPSLSGLLPGPAEGSGQSSIHELAGQIDRLDLAGQSDVRDALGALLGGAEEPQGMPIEHVTTLIEAGFEVGFHTRLHPRLDSLPDNQLADALTTGRDIVERAVGNQIALIAYPHGAADARVASAAREAGYIAGFVGSGVAVRGNANPLLQPRVGPSPLSLGHFALSLARALVRQGDVSSPRL